MQGWYRFLFVGNRQSSASPREMDRSFEMTRKFAAHAANRHDFPMKIGLALDPGFHYILPPVRFGPPVADRSACGYGPHHATVQDEHSHHEILAWFSRGLWSGSRDGSMLDPAGATDATSATARNAVGGPQQRSTRWWSGTAWSSRKKRAANRPRWRTDRR